MTDTLVFGGKTFTSSKRAADESGYAQDYIGQLARKGLISAERVGNLWYVSMESLTAYKANAESYVPNQPQSQVGGREADSYISFDGKDYVAASRAAKLTGYNPDYIGQLARGGKILSRQVGNRWYVERESLLTHKREKDALLAAVQAESVGIAHRTDFEAPTASIRGLEKQQTVAQPPVQHFQYFQDNRALMPILKGAPAKSSVHTIDLRVAPRMVVAPRAVREHALESDSPSRIGGKTMSIALRSGAMLTVMLMLSYGYISLKDSSVLVSNFNMDTGQGLSDVVRHSAIAGYASDSLQYIGDAIEDLIAPEMHYERK